MYSSSLRSAHAHSTYIVGCPWRPSHSSAEPCVAGITVGLSLLSLLFLVNRIYYNDSEIKFVFIYRKVTVSYNQIKEIFVQRDLIYGTKVIFNLEKETKEECLQEFLNTKDGRKSLVLLMHDSNDKTQTVEALPEIIQHLKNEGYTFKTFYEIF